MTQRSWLFGIAMLAATVSVAPVEARETAKTTLLSTGVVPLARGKATASVLSTSAGRLDVKVQKLARDASYELVADGIRVLTLHTTRGGRAKARLATAPRRATDGVLGFDPRGAVIEVRDQSGAVVLTGTIPRGAPPADDVTCCVPDDDGVECEDRTPDDCAAAGGTVSSAPSCLPDPCGATPPPDRDVVCCIPDDSGPECEDRTQAECLADGGMIVEAPSCASDPCGATSPPAGTPNPSATRTVVATPIRTVTATPLPTTSPTPTVTETQEPTVTPTPTTCDERCWASFWSCLDHCTLTYCAAFCQVDLGRCLDSCPP